MAYEKDITKWTWKNAAPYLLAAIIPTVLVCFQVIPAWSWTLVFILDMVGANIADVTAITIAGQNSLKLDEGDDKDEKNT